MTNWSIPYAGPGMAEVWSTYNGVSFGDCGKPGGWSGDEFTQPEPPPAPPERKVDKRTFLTVRTAPWLLSVLGALRLECGPHRWTQRDGELVKELKRRIKLDLCGTHPGRTLVITWPGELVR